MDALKEFLSRDMLGLSVGQLTGAFIAIFAGYLAKHLVEILLRRIKKIAGRTRTQMDDIFIEALIAPAGWAVILLGVYIAAHILPLPEEPIDIMRFVDALARGASILLIVWFGVRLSDRGFALWAQRAIDTESRLDDQAIPILKKTVRVFLVLVGASLFLQNLGYSVGSLIAGLGLGGAALALASKDTLSNLFGAIVIFWDRPFAVGDWVELEGVEGTVEQVGLRTTRIRTFANSLITLPNMKLTTASINNWSKMEKRRIKMTIGVTYDATPEQLEAGVKAIQNIIVQMAEMKNDFYLVRFDAFGASSLNIFVYCFTETTVWADFLAVKEQFMLEIMRRFQEIGLSFAFPTQTVHVASMPETKI